MDKNKLLIPATIILASTILGGFYYASEINKQRSIEKQQEMKLVEERRVIQAKIEQEDQNEYQLQLCLDNADTKYRESAQYWLNQENKIGAGNVVDAVNKEKVVLQQDKDECYKRYR